MNPKILQLILSLLPSVLSLIPVAEAAFSGRPGSGAAKKELVMQGVQIGTQVAGQFVPELQNPEVLGAVHRAAGAVVDATVAAMNAAPVGATVPTPTAAPQ